MDDQLVHKVRFKLRSVPPNAEIDRAAAIVGGPKAFADQRRQPLDDRGLHGELRVQGDPLIEPDGPFGLQLQIGRGEDQIIHVHFFVGNVKIGMRVL